MNRAVHDRGGWPTEAPIDRSEHELADWELLADGLAVGQQEVRRVELLERAAHRDRLGTLL